MRFTTSLANLASAASLFTSVALAGTSTYSLEVSEGGIVPRGGCQIEFTDNICTGSCHDIVILTDSYTCQQIDDMVAAGTNGGNVGPLDTCGGQISVNFYGDGAPRATFSVGTDCANGCPFTLDGENTVSCSVSDGS